MTSPVTNGLSPLVKAVSALGTTGAVIIFAGYLIYAVVEGGKTDTVRALGEVMETMRVHEESERFSAAMMESLLRQICVNTAKDSPERSACF